MQHEVSLHNTSVVGPISWTCSAGTLCAPGCPSYYDYLRMRQDPSEILLYDIRLDLQLEDFMLTCLFYDTARVPDKDASVSVLN